MKYNEFKNNYKWIINQAPDIAALYGQEITLEMITTNYTKRGKKWVENDSTTELVNVEFYFNTFDAIPFFRNLGGVERITKMYTKYGYIPVESVSISPDKTKKVVRTFKF